jgi:hypothetical protein
LIRSPERSGLLCFCGGGLEDEVEEDGRGETGAGLWGQRGVEARREETGVDVEAGGKGGLGGSGMCDGLGHSAMNIRIMYG